MTVDLPRDSIRGVARADGDEAEVAARKVWFGCLQGALEHEFVADYGRDPGGPAIEVVSTCSFHGDAGLVALRPGSTPPVSDPERAARVAAVLATGRTVVAPPAVLQGGTLAWWEVASARSRALCNSICSSSWSRAARAHSSGFAGTPAITRNDGMQFYASFAIVYDFAAPGRGLR